MWWLTTPPGRKNSPFFGSILENTISKPNTNTLKKKKKEKTGSLPLFEHNLTFNYVGNDLKLTLIAAQ